MRKPSNLFFVSVLLIATLGIEGCFHHTAGRAADALRDTAKRRQTRKD